MWWWPLSSTHFWTDCKMTPCKFQSLPPMFYNHIHNVLNNVTCCQETVHLEIHFKCSHLSSSIKKYIFILLHSIFITLVTCSEILNSSLWTTGLLQSKENWTTKHQTAKQKRVSFDFFLVYSATVPWFLESLCCLVWVTVGWFAPAVPW